MSMIKIRSRCEFNGEVYDGVVVCDGVNIAVGDACDPRLGTVVSFDVPSPVLFLAGIRSVSVGEGIPHGWLVLNTGE